jgi:DNA-binding GntR family transcriptional regulator
VQPSGGCCLWQGYEGAVAPDATMWVGSQASGIMVAAAALRAGRRSTATRPPAAERVASALRVELVSQKTPPGSQLNQEAWARRLGVSRAALREGLKVLTAEGLLRHDPHRGYFANFDIGSMGQLYWLRVVVERALIRSIRPPRGEETQLLVSAHKRSVDAFAAGDAAACIAADRDFFFCIYNLSEFEYLRREACRLWDLSSAFRLFSTTEGTAMAASETSFREGRSRQLRALVEGEPELLADLVAAERLELVKSFGADSPALAALFDLEGETL